jgi:hypothetical protein
VIDRARPARRYLYDMAFPSETPLMPMPLQWGQLAAIRGAAFGPPFAFIPPSGRAGVRQVRWRRLKWL